MFQWMNSVDEFSTRKELYLLTKDCSSTTIDIHVGPKQICQQARELIRPGKTVIAEIGNYSEGSDHCLEKLTQTNPRAGVRLAYQIFPCETGLEMSP